MRIWRAGGKIMQGISLYPLLRKAGFKRLDSVIHCGRIRIEYKLSKSWGAHWKLYYDLDPTNHPEVGPAWLDLDWAYSMCKKDKYWLKLFKTYVKIYEAINDEIGEKLMAKGYLEGEE